MTRTSTLETQATPYRLFQARARRVARLSPGFVRVTLTGDDLDEFADNGYDQRVKLILPLPGAGFDHLDGGPGWYETWRAQPDHRRNPIRTYTARAVRHEQREVDLDFALHADGGPASGWAESAAPGDPVALIGPNVRFPGDHAGVDFRPPAGTRPVLLAGDETAVPAIAGILERLPAGTRGEVLMEVLAAADRLALTAPASMRLTWLARDGASHGARLVPALRDAAARLIDPRQRLTEQALVDIDVDTEPLWEVPDANAASTTGLYAWLAGEAGVIKTLRRHLVTELGLDRRSVAFMGYWRLGRSEAN